MARTFSPWIHSMHDIEYISKHTHKNDEPPFPPVPLIIISDDVTPSPTNRFMIDFRTIVSSLSEINHIITKMLTPLYETLHACYLVVFFVEYMKYLKRDLCIIFPRRCTRVSCHPVLLCGQVDRMVQQAYY